MKVNKMTCRLLHNAVLCMGIDAYPGAYGSPPPPPTEPPSRQGQILAALTAAGPQGLRPAEVRQATGVPQGTVASALHGLMQRGQVRKVHDRYVATGQERAAGP